MKYCLLILIFFIFSCSKYEEYYKKESVGKLTGFTYQIETKSKIEVIIKPLFDSQDLVEAPTIIDDNFTKINIFSEVDFLKHHKGENLNNYFKVKDYIQPHGYYYNFSENKQNLPVYNFSTINEFMSFFENHPRVPHILLLQYNDTIFKEDTLKIRIEINLMNNKIFTYFSYESKITF